MKRLIIVALSVFIFAACNSVPDEAATESISHQDAAQYILDNNDNKERCTLD